MNKILKILFNFNALILSVVLALVSLSVQIYLYSNYKEIGSHGEHVNYDSLYCFEPNISKITTIGNDWHELVIDIEGLSKTFEITSSHNSSMFPAGSNSFALKMYRNSHLMLNGGHNIEIKQNRIKYENFCIKSKKNT
jgi:hypothetical protein